MIAELKNIRRLDEREFGGMEEWGMLHIYTTIKNTFSPSENAYFNHNR